MHVSSPDMALAYDSPLFWESLSARFPHSSVCAKNHGRGVQGEERSHFHDHNSLLVLPFLLFGFVLVTR